MFTTHATDDLESFKRQSIDAIKCEVYLLLLDSDYVDVLNRKEPLFKPEWVKWRQSIRLQMKQYSRLIQTSSSIEQIEDILNHITWLESPGICLHLRRPS